MNFNNLVVVAAAAAAVVERLQAKYSTNRLFNLGEMSYFNQRNAVQ